MALYFNPSAEMSGNINELAAALAIAQSELDTAKKDSKGYGYSYSDLATVIAAAKPILAKNDLAIVQLVGQTTTEGVSLTTILTHKSGQYLKTLSSCPIAEMKGCNAVQQIGASLSYLRRYSYQAIIGMASEDNDGSSEGFKKSSGEVATSASSAIEPARRRFAARTTAPAANGADVGGDI